MRLIFGGTSGRNRTCGFRVRNPTLYPRTPSRGFDGGLTSPGTARPSGSGAWIQGAQRSLSRLPVETAVHRFANPCSPGHRRDQELRGQSVCGIGHGERGGDDRGERRRPGQVMRNQREFNRTDLGPMNEMDRRMHGENATNPPRKQTPASPPSRNPAGVATPQRAGGRVTGEPAAVVPATRRGAPWPPSRADEGGGATAPEPQRVSRRSRSAPLEATAGDAPLLAPRSPVLTPAPAAPAAPAEVAARGSGAGLRSTENPERAESERAKSPEEPPPRGPAGQSCGQAIEPMCVHVCPFIGKVRRPPTWWTGQRWRRRLDRGPAVPSDHGRESPMASYADLRHSQ